MDDEGPLSPPHGLHRGRGGMDVRLERLEAVERVLWGAERAAHSTARLSRLKRLPVYLNAIDAPSPASGAALLAIHASTTAAKTLEPRKREFAAEKYWKWDDGHWNQAKAAA